MKLVTTLCHISKESSHSLSLWKETSSVKWLQCTFSAQAVSLIWEGGPSCQPRPEGATSHCGVPVFWRASVVMFTAQIHPVSSDLTCYWMCWTAHMENWTEVKDCGLQPLSATASISLHRLREEWVRISALTDSCNRWSKRLLHFRKEWVPSKTSGSVGSIMKQWCVFPSHLTR